jgi:hypothetical protein
VVGGVIVAKKGRKIWLDRVAHDELVDALKVGQPLRPVIEFRNARQQMMDVQFRRPSGRRSRASLYAGLTRILDVEVLMLKDQDPQFRCFIEHETHREAAPDWRTWATWASVDRMVELWPAVEGYLRQREQWLESDMKAAHHVMEGRVHASMCRSTVTSYRVLNREASPSFADTETKDEMCGRIRSEIRRVLDGLPEPKAWLKYHEFGTSPDILAVDSEGRLIVAEAKPAAYESGIGKGPIQVRFYAGLIARWMEHDGEAPDALSRMLVQRIAVGLDEGTVPTFRADMPVVPVLALGPGEISGKRLEHTLALREALAGLQTAEAGATSAVEIWRLRADGNMVEQL